ncbi:MAG: hypothetical protein O2822_01215 [Chloroflexi bacterium]|nr:hypothetical protein [Chloroflexota bacterium]
METRKKTTIISALVAGAVLTIASVGVAAAQTPDAAPSMPPPATAPATPGDGEHPCSKDGAGHQAKGEMRGQMGQMQGQHGARHAAMHAGGGA